MNLSSLDLNLFLVLHTVLQERSATRAARKLHVTQSAVSNALARLRAVLGDPLVVRSGRGLVPTPRAVELAPMLAQVTAQLEAALDRGRAFVPAESTRTFTLAAADNHQMREVPRVAAVFAQRLPGAHLRIVSADFLAASDGLTTGEVDAAFAPSTFVPPGHHSHELFTERSTFVVRHDHPLRGKITPAQFASLGQIDIEVMLGKKGIGHRLAEQEWRRLKLTREVRFTVSYFTTAALIAAHTDCAASLPSHLAEEVCRWLPLRPLQTTFPQPSIAVSLLWHERTATDPGARFFRSIIIDALTPDAPRRARPTRKPARARP